MAILPLKTSLSITNPCWEGNLAFSWAARRECTTKTPKKIGVSSKNDLIPMVSKFSREKKEYESKEITISKEPKRRLADTWQEIHGQDDWAGMLDPFDPLLRSELIRYGDMAQACYDAYDHDPNSKYCGNCKVERSSFFENLGWKENGYEVTRYIYSKYNVKLPIFFAKSLHSDRWSLTANWVGYVAVSNDETSAYLGRRDITIAWRGTARKAEWIADLMDMQKPVSNYKIPSPNSKIKVHTGFLHVYTDEEMGCSYSKNSAREQILGEVEKLKQKYANEELNITITGHSLGSSLAILNAYDIAESGLNKMGDGRVIPICVFSFSGPRVGNPRFKERLKGLGVKVLRVLNIHDGIPKVPGIFFNEHTPQILQKIGEMLPWCYSHIGEELALDHKKSPFLKETGDRGCFHNLEAHLHLLAGYHGKGSRFWVASGREITLVNKHSDFLKDDFLVPPNWWRTENRKMIKNHVRQWKRDLEDYLPPQGVHHHLQQLRLTCEE